MRIGIDARMYSSLFTGIGRYVYELTENLFEIEATHKEGPKNEYILFFNQPEFDQFKNRKKELRGVKVKPFLAGARHYSWAEQTKFWRKLEKEKLDLMHFTHFNAPILYRKPSVVTIHDLTLSFFPGEKMTSCLHRMAYHFTLRSIVKRASKIITVSEYTKKDLEKLLKVQKERIEVIYEGVNPIFRKIEDPEFLARIRAKYELKTPFLLYTGVWRSHKNLVNLIKAFAFLKEKYKLPGNLVITGKEDPFYPEVQRTVRESNLWGIVKFTGLVPEEDLVALYNLAALYVQPSFYEGFGLSCLEAFACGTPVCCTQTSCLPEICGEAAFYFDPYDFPQMAEKIWVVFKNEELQKDLIQKGFERVKNFSWRRMARETLKVYQSI